MHQYDELLRTILEKRGLTTLEEAEIFINPDYDRDLHDPFLMKDMDKSVERIILAIENNENIVIYSDYDCDGIPGAVVLNDLFKKIGYENYEVYIPMRNSEGYGLNEEAILDFSKRNVNLVITIDLGITAVHEVKEANKLGIDVIITDHHIPHTELPEAFAILNPKTDDYPDKNLCGAGVAFKLAQGFVKKYSEKFNIHEGWEKWLLDMAGMATLSDLVPLRGENRAISYFGMKVLRKSPRPGFQKLLSKVRIDQKHLNEDDIGFMVAPRINAASRMDDPMRAYELLSTTDEKEAGALATHLSKINDERKTVVTSIMREVNKNFEKRELREVIVVGNPKWQVGVLGIVASRIVENYGKPTFVWGSDENDQLKGSCRSNGEVSLVELMQEASDSFSEFGGHEGAGGFTVLKEKVHFLEETLSEFFHKVKKDKVEEVVHYDARLGLDEVNIKNYKELDKLAPFGFDNPKPVFFFEGVKVVKVRKFGKNGSGEHLEITFTDSSNKKIKAVSFFSNESSFKGELEEGRNVDLYATIELSRWMGKTELRLRVVDIV